MKEEMKRLEKGSKIFHDFPTIVPSVDALREAIRSDKRPSEYDLGEDSRIKDLEKYFREAYPLAKYPKKAFEPLVVFDGKNEELDEENIPNNKSYLSLDGTFCAYVGTSGSEGVFRDVDVACFVDERGRHQSYKEFEALDSGASRSSFVQRATNPFDFMSGKIVFTIISEVTAQEAPVKTDEAIVMCLRKIFRLQRSSGNEMFSLMVDRARRDVLPALYALGASHEEVDGIETLLIDSTPEKFTMLQEKIKNFLIPKLSHDVALEVFKDSLWNVDAFVLVRGRKTVRIEQRVTAELDKDGEIWDSVFDAPRWSVLQNTTFVPSQPLEYMFSPNDHEEIFDRALLAFQRIDKLRR